MISDYIVLSFKSLRKRRLRTWLTMLGIFIGIAAVVALIGLGEGLRDAINSQFSFLGTQFIAVTASGGFGPPGTGVVEPLTDRDLDAIENINGVEGVASRLIKSTKMVFNNKAVFTYVASMPDGDSRKLVEEAVNMKAEKGRLLKDGDKNVVVLGSAFYEDEDRFGKKVIPGSKILINDKEFEVVGIMEKKGNFQLDGAVLMNDDDMRELYDIDKNKHDIIAVKFNENADVNKIKEDIEKELRRTRDVKKGEENFAVQTPTSILEGVNSVITGIQIFVYIIAGISILVGGIGIMNTMYTAVVERKKEIGIMKSIGAKNSTIFSLFFIESGLLGIIGGVVGVTIGVILSKGIAYIGQITLGSDLISASISYTLVFGALLFSFVIGSFFGTLPAIRAAKLNPVDAIRSVK